MMARDAAAAAFAEDPLSFLDRSLAQGADGVWSGRREFCLGNADAARAVLANARGLYREHSDFFQAGREQFGPRSAQVEIGRRARLLLQEVVRARAARLAADVRAALATDSEWPDAGNWLAYRHLADALAAPGETRLRRLVEEIVRRAVLAGARERQPAWRRLLFRRRAMRELGRAIAARRRRGSAEPADLLDVVVLGGRCGQPDDLLAEVYLSFVFAVAGSVGFTLGWSVYLLGTHPGTQAEPGWIVREALRLWPVAWQLARRPVQAHEIAGTAVSPHDTVVVCPYLVHRDPRRWHEPTRFRPERWAAVSARQGGAFIPFGYGPHRCVAASLSLRLAADLLRAMLEAGEPQVSMHDGTPCIGPALAPPRFTLRLVPRHASAAA
jgi:cytochrome P450